jgi:hypothetical protein
MRGMMSPSQSDREDDECDGQTPLRKNVLSDSSSSKSAPKLRITATSRSQKKQENMAYRDIQSIILLHVKHSSGMGVFFGRCFKYPK